MRGTRVSLEPTLLDRYCALQDLLAPTEADTDSRARLLAGLSLADLRLVAAAHAIIARAADALDPSWPGAGEAPRPTTL